MTHEKVRFAFCVKASWQRRIETEECECVVCAKDDCAFQ